MRRAALPIGAIVLSLAALFGQQLPGTQVALPQVVVRPCLMVAPQILLFTVEERYHRLVLFNTCSSPLGWSVLNTFPFIRVDTSQAADPIPPGKMTPVGVYVDWGQAPGYAVSIPQPSPVLDWLERVTGKELPRQARLYLAVAFFSFCERNTPARACVPVLVFLLRAGG